MPDRRLALTNIASALQQQAAALQALTSPHDSDLPIGMRLLLDAIDRVNVAASAPPQSRDHHMTPGAYLKHRRTAHGLGIHDVAAALATEPRLAEHVRAEWLEQIEADIVPMSFNTIVALRRAFTFDLDILAQLAAIAMHLPVEPPRLCRICACSEADACLGHHSACSWIEHDLCSACFALRVTPADRVAIAAALPSARDVAA